MNLDGEIHKLLGDDYKKYRLITEKIKSLHSAKKSDVLSSPPPPPPPAGIAVGSKKKKKKSV